MLAKLTSVSLNGIEAIPVEIEVDQTTSFGKSVIVGLPDAAVRESLERVQSAIQNSNYPYPDNKRLVINLAPADQRKEGPSLDLPIALGILFSMGQLAINNLDRFAIVGELALDGSLRPVRGCLSMAILCRDNKVPAMLVPAENAAEAGIVEGVEIYPVRNLTDAVGFLCGEKQIPKVVVDREALFGESLAYPWDFGEVKGQDHAKRALTVGAAGGHNIIMIGPPGSGKTMLSKRLPGILPSMEFEEALETTRIHSVAGQLGGKPIICARPFRSPHHTISGVALVGGGTTPKPGEISLAHNGVLFLDELPEFNRKTLEVLRQPLEAGSITVDRSMLSSTFPARFMLVAAMNPCPCGYLTDPKRNCRCSPLQVQNYLSKISGPLLDRIDIHLEVPAVDWKSLSGKGPQKSSEQMRSEVCRARDRQKERFKGSKIYCNAQMGPKEMEAYCKVRGEALNMLNSAMESLNLSARAYSRIQKLARTLADLEGGEEVGVSHIAEAIQYRSLDRAVPLGR